MDLPQTFVRDGKTYQLDPLGRERLLKLAAFLDNIAEENFSFGTLLACAIGWLPSVFPEDWIAKRFSVSLVGSNDSCWTAAAHYFGITYTECIGLFDLTLSGPYTKMGFRVYSEVKAPTVAQVIREFVEGLPCSVG